MSDRDEKAQRAAEALDMEAVEATEPGEVRHGFRTGARWQREALLSDEAVERAARVVAGMEPGEGWPTNAEMGGGPTGTRDDEYRDACMEAARSVLTAALGEDEGNE